MCKADGTLENEETKRTRPSAFSPIVSPPPPPPSSSSSCPLLQQSTSQSVSPEILIMACRRHQRRHRRRREDEHAEEEMTTPASPPSSPHFFKIVLSHTLETGKLGIPKSFFRRYGIDLSSLVLLKVPGGSTWPVKLEKSNSGIIWLGQGWQKFMEHYSIDHGHLIVFKYEGDSIFHVIIFDKSASEIDYPLRIESDMSSPEDNFLSRREENVMKKEHLDGFVPCSWPSSNSSSQELGGQVQIKQSQCQESSSEPAFQSSPFLMPVTAHEKANEFEPEHPFFKVVISPGHINNLRIPCKFFRKYVQKNKPIATLRYSDRSWYVKLLRHEPRDMATLSIGWSLFVRETGLRVRDVCMFELIDRNNNVFRVSIFSSDGWTPIEHSQCLSPFTAHENVHKFESEHPFFSVVILPKQINRNYLEVRHDVHSRGPASYDSCLFKPIMGGEAPGLSTPPNCMLGSRLVRICKRSLLAQRRFLRVRARR